jgi:hypothetical protein
MSGTGRKREEQRFVGSEMVEDRGQESRLPGRRPQTLPPKAAQRQEAIEPVSISGEKG